MSNSISFMEWYNKFQQLIVLWKELSTNETWLEAHENELKLHGLNPSELTINIKKDIAMLTHQILNYDDEEKE